MWYVVGVGVQQCTSLGILLCVFLTTHEYSTVQYSGCFRVQYSGCLMARLIVQYQYQPQALNTDNCIAVARSIVCELGIQCVQ